MARSLRQVAEAPVASRNAEAASSHREAFSEALGARIRQERELAGLTVRGLAARINVSPSLISQIERSRATPSVATLWAVATELGIPIGDLFNGLGAAQPARAAARSPVQQHETRKALTLEGGVRWERLTPGSDDVVDFVYIVYPVGAESCPPDASSRHGGQEYGYVLSGTLGVQIGTDEYVVRTNDSICFESAAPHRLWAMGDEPAVAVWAVVNMRADDPAKMARD
jgi:transcriptional regulator with XRE-family HTH domain